MNDWTVVVRNWPDEVDNIESYYVNTSPIRLRQVYRDMVLILQQLLRTEVVFKQPVVRCSGAASFKTDYDNLWFDVPIEVEE